MYLAIQREPLRTNDGLCIDLPVSHPMPTKSAVNRWLIARGLTRQAFAVPLSTFVSYGGLEPGRNKNEPTNG